MRLTMNQRICGETERALAGSGQSLTKQPRKMLS
jgi:hypothetical protein